MPYVIGSPEFARFRTLAAAVSTEPPLFLQHLAAQLLKFMLTCTCTCMYYAHAHARRIHENIDIHTRASCTMHIRTRARHTRAK